MTVKIQENKDWNIFVSLPFLLSARFVKIQENKDWNSFLNASLPFLFISVKIQENKDWNFSPGPFVPRFLLVKIQENKDWNVALLKFPFYSNKLKSKKTRIEIVLEKQVLPLLIELKSKKTRIEISQWADRKVACKLS